MDYLDKTEYCLFNEMMYNQYCSADFGSHPFDKKFGFTLSHSQGRAWWCCDYHGLQAMLATHDIIVTDNNGVKQVNLYSYTHFKDAVIAFTLGKVAKNDAKYNLVIDSCGNSEQVIALRAPSWASSTNVLVNGKESAEKPVDGYIQLKQAWKKGDEITIDFAYKLQLVTFDRKIIPVAEMPEKLSQTALRYGPYLMSVDNVYSLPFMSEISTDNIIYLQEKELAGGNPEKATAPVASNLGEAYLQMDYKHEGYNSTGKVTMRPMSEVTYGQLPNIQLWFNFEKR